MSDNNVDEIEETIRLLHYQLQEVRDQWFAASEAALARLRSSMIEAASFGRDFRHLIPQPPINGRTDSGLGARIPPLPDVPDDDGRDEKLRIWQETFGRSPGEQP